MLNLKSHLRLILFCLVVTASVANATDQELATSLKKELEFDTNRRNDFKNHRQGKKTYEQEREKGLSLFLEEQEKWDVTREKGLKEQRASRLKSNELDETSPEYAQDQKEKKKYEADIEASRKKQIATKQQVQDLFKNKISVTEEEELGVYSERPRYALRMRGKNKWTGQGKFSSGGSSSGASSGGYDGATIPSAPFDYPPVPNQDYVPTDNFDELPPPPPMMPYDNGNQYPPFEGDSGFGPATGYPPPPPDGGWDF